MSGYPSPSYADPTQALQAANKEYVDRKFAQVISPLSLGAFGNGSSNPLSSVTYCQGQNTTGWTLAQWQVLFPFANALSNEIDQCAILQAIVSASGSHSYVHVAGGRYLFNFAPSITVSGAFSLIGDGPGVTCFEVTTATAIALPITVPLAAPNYGAVLMFKNFSVYSTLTTALGGQGISITSGPGTPGRPLCYFDTVVCGQPENNTNVGVLSVGVYLFCIDRSWFVDCAFNGSQNTTIGGPSNLSGIGVQSNGNGTTSPTSFYTFGPNMVNCYWGNMHQGIVIGDGVSTAYTQGVKVSNSTWNFCNYGIVWRASTRAMGNDYLAVDQCDMACNLNCIWTDTVATHMITGNYFLLSPNCKAVQIDNTGPINTGGVIAGNNFIAFGGTASQGLVFNGTSYNQPSIYVTNNLFFDFGGASTNPLVVGSGITGYVFAGNTFRDNANLPTDAGTNNHWFNNSVETSSPAVSRGYIYGVPSAAPATPGSTVDNASLSINAPAGGWSSSNLGAALIVGQGHLAGNPAIALLDSGNANPVAIFTSGSIFQVAAMPPLNNGTTAPTVLLQVSGASPLGLRAAGNWTANGTTSVSLTALAPAGAHATVQEWLTVTDATGNTRYIPCF